jgi:AP-2 complex subunit alpha
MWLVYTYSYVIILLSIILFTVSSFLTIKHILLFLSLILTSSYTQGDISAEQRLSQENGTLNQVDSQQPSADLLGDLLGPLAIEGPPSSSVHPQPSSNPGIEGTVVDATAIVPAGQEASSVQVL